MKSCLLLLVMSVILLTLFSCGGGSSSGGSSSSGAPQISVSLNNSQPVKVGDALQFTMQWSDSEADINTVYEEAYFGSQRWAHSHSASYYNISGTAGVVTIQWEPLANRPPGMHVYKFYVRDLKGQQSNIVEINIQFVS